MRNFTNAGLLAGLLITPVAGTAQPITGSQAGQSQVGPSSMMGQGQMMAQGQRMNQAEMQRRMDLMHQSCGRMMSEMNRMPMNMRDKRQPSR